MAAPQLNNPPAADNDKGALLHQLRIERSQREEEDTETRRWPWLVGGAVVLVLIAVGVWFFVGRKPAVVVHTTMAQPMTSGGPSTSVLDATGYVTARRQATVSAQITGKLTDVLKDRAPA